VNQLRIVNLSMDASSVSGPVCLFICSPIVQLDGVGGADIGMQRPCIHSLPCRKHLAKMDIKWLSLYKLLTFLDSCPRSSLECKGEKVPPQAIYVPANNDVNQLGFGGLSLMQDWTRKCMPYAEICFSIRDLLLLIDASLNGWQLRVD